MQIRVAKSGKNALTATDPNDFIFHTGYNTLKIVAQGTLTGQNVDSDPKTFSVAHGQSHVPICFAFAKFPDGKIALPFSYDYSDSGQRFEVEVDSSDVHFKFHRPGSDYTVDISYFVFEAPI